MRELELAVANGRPVVVHLVGGHPDRGPHRAMLSSLDPSPDSGYDKIANGVFPDPMLAFFLGYPQGFEVLLVEDQQHSQVRGVMRAKP